MATYRELLENGKKYLKEKQIEDGNLDAWLLMEHVCGISRTWYFVHEQEEAPKAVSYTHLDVYKRQS